MNTREQISGRRLRLTDDQRRQLAIKGRTVARDPSQAELWFDDAS